MKRTALLSVFEKAGIVTFAQDLINKGWEIIASDGTAKTLAAAGLPVKDVAELVGGAAILGHRVVTLSREIHAGLLATTDAADIEELGRLGVPFIDLVCVDLYPLEAEIAKPEAIKAAVIEKTDIGGPTMLRSAAKGRRIVIADPADREIVLRWLENGEPNREEFIDSLAAKAEFVVANYCLASARYHGRGDYDGILGVRIRDCAYGENPYQTPASVYRVSSIVTDPFGIDSFRQVEGSVPSFINNTDLNRLAQTITHIAAGFEVNFGQLPFIAVGCKHGNPCGVGVGNSPVGAMVRMIEGHPEALFGGSVMVNFPMTAQLAQKLSEHEVKNGRRVVDVVIAPDFEPEAVKALKRKTEKCRLFVNEALANLDINTLDRARRFSYLREGFQTQPNYTFVLDLSDSRAVWIGKYTDQQKRDAVMLSAVGRTSNSNTITIGQNEQLLGSGLAQVSRKLASRVAILSADDGGHNVNGSVAYSDSFFPFDDGPKVLIAAGIAAVLTTHGSRNDGEVMRVFESAEIAVCSLPDKDARGFFGHHG